MWESLYILSLNLKITQKRGWNLKSIFTFKFSSSIWMQWQVDVVFKHISQCIFWKSKQIKTLQNIDILKWWITSFKWYSVMESVVNYFKRYRSRYYSFHLENILQKHSLGILVKCKYLSLVRVERKKTIYILQNFFGISITDKY